MRFCFAIICLVVIGVSLLAANAEPPAVRGPLFEASDPGPNFLIDPVDSVTNLENSGDRDAGPSLSPPVISSLPPRPTTYAIELRGRDRQGRAIVSRGSAVCVGGDRFLSAAHLAEGVFSRVAFVAIDGHWKSATFLPRGDGQDLADVIVPGVNLPAVNTRAPRYLERCRLTGIASGNDHDGLITDLVYPTASLDADDAGIQPGDSGGAVVGEGDALIGIISGYAGDRSRNDRRTVRFVPLGDSLSRERSVATRPSQESTQPSCNGNACRVSPPRTWIRLKR